VASQIDVVNRALTKLGAGRITSLTDNNKRAAVMQSLWDTVRQAELRRRWWKFSIERTTLALLASPPTWGFLGQFQLPADFLRMVQVNDTFAIPALSDYTTQDNSAWEIEGTAILTDFPAPLKIRYVADVTDPGRFDPLFVEVMACKLAYEACEELTNSSPKRQQMAQDYKDALGEATKANALERPPQGIADDSWMVIRL
jgi:hypothetical protein